MGVQVKGGMQWSGNVKMNDEYLLACGDEDADCTDAGHQTLECSVQATIISGCVKNCE